MSLDRDRRPLAAFLLATLALLCAGCASVTLSHEEALAEVQSFADEVARVYQLPPVRIVVREGSVIYHGVRMMPVSPAVLDVPPPARDVHVARGLAFFVIQPPAPVSEADEIRINRRAYPEMNVATVDILARVKGLPERVAVQLVHGYLVAGGERSPSRVVPPTCEQVLAFTLYYRRYQFEAPPPCP